MGGVHTVAAAIAQDALQRPRRRGVEPGREVDEHLRLPRGARERVDVHPGDLAVAGQAHEFCDDGRRCVVWNAGNVE